MCKGCSDYEQEWNDTKISCNCECRKIAVLEEDYEVMTAFAFCEECSHHAVFKIVIKEVGEDEYVDYLDKEASQ